MFLFSFLHGADEQRSGFLPMLLLDKLFSEKNNGVGEMGKKLILLTGYKKYYHSPWQNKMQTSIRVFHSLTLP